MKIIVTNTQYYAFNQIMDLVVAGLPARVRNELGSPEPLSDPGKWRFDKVAPVLIERGLLCKRHDLVYYDKERFLDTVYYYFEVRV